MNHPEVWFIDTEWGFEGGRVDHESAFTPVVLCAVGKNSKVRKFFWAQDPQLSTFIQQHRDDFLVAHYAIAEMKYLLRLGIELPPHWYDTFVQYRNCVNSPQRKKAGLSPALHSLGLPHMAPESKKELQLKILNLDFDFNSEADQKLITDYCFSDCDGCEALFDKICDEKSLGVMGHWSEYLSAAAKMELRGVSFDVDTHQKISGNIPQLRLELTNKVNETFPVYNDGVFKAGKMLEWCAQEGITWPQKRSNSGQLKHSFADDQFKLMEGHHEFIRLVKEVRKSLASFSNRKLIVDPQTSRHYFNTSVFRTISSRNQPKGFVFGGPKWRRYLMVPPSEDHVLVYVDYTAQEIGIAAALSKDAQMRKMYEGADAHMHFAIRAGAAPQGALKSTHSEIRKIYKTVNLGVLYGQTEYGISRQLGISRRAARKIIHEHQSLFSTFWNWSEDIVQAAFDRGWIQTPCGWRSLVPHNSKPTTWKNWPMQSTGADIMRLTIIYLDQQNVEVLAPVHDGFLLTCRKDELPQLRVAIDQAFKTAVDQVIPGFPMKWDTEVFEGRFEDEDGRPVWNQLETILDGIGAQKRSEPRV